MGRKSDEEKAAAADAKRKKEAERAEADRLKRIDDVRKAFSVSPAGRARRAYENGDQVFQYELDVRKTQAIVVPMLNAYSSTSGTADPSAILNSVCHEGWDLVNGSFVFLEQGSESRDKFLASGQQVAVRGTIIGYYLFKRCEANKREVVDPWETDAVAPLSAPGTEHEAETPHETVGRSGVVDSPTGFEITLQPRSGSSSSTGRPPSDT